MLIAFHLPNDKNVLEMDLLGVRRRGHAKILTGLRLCMACLTDEPKDGQSNE